MFVTHDHEGSFRIAEIPQEPEAVNQLVHQLAGNGLLEIGATDAESRPDPVGINLNVRAAEIQAGRCSSYSALGWRTAAETWPLPDRTKLNENHTVRMFREPSAGGPRS